MLQSVCGGSRRQEYLHYLLAMKLWFQEPKLLSEKAKWFEKMGGESSLKGICFIKW